MSSQFSLIRNIDVDREQTWKNDVFLTFDIDWASDSILNHCIDIVEKAEVHATWFVTHETPVLGRLRENPKFDLGIHPNFNFLLNGQSSEQPNAEKIVDEILRIVPEAKTVRSHSMTQSTGLLKLFHDKGMTHDCNHFIPYQSGMDIKPWALWTGLTKVPYFWEDDLECVYGHQRPVLDLMNMPGLKVFDFHPIHVFLNTEDLDRYERTRDIHHHPDLANHVNQGDIGARASLESFLRGFQ